MGWGSSKKKVYIDCSVARVIEDDMIGDALQSALIKSVFQGGTIPDAVMDEALNGGHRLFERMYRYAERGDYHYGLPNARVLTTSDGFDLAKAAIESEVGQAVTVDYMHFRPLNNVHAGWQHCVDSWGYNHDTNELEFLTIFLGTPNPVYLDKMVAVTQSDSTGVGLPEASSQGTFGDTLPGAGYSPIRPSLYTNSGLANQVIEQEIRIGDNETESVEIHYGWLDANGDYQQTFQVIDLTSYDGDQEYYQAKAHYFNGLGDVYIYWIYDPYASGVHTALNDVFADLTYIDPGTYFPFAVVRSHGENRGDDALENTNEFITTKKLMKYLQMDFKEVADTINDDDDAKKIEQAVMMMGVPINAQDESGMDYLHRYFENIAANLPPEALTPKPKVTTSKAAAPEVSYAVQITDADFMMTISFDKVNIGLKAMDLGLGRHGVTNTTETLDIMPIGTTEKNVADYTVRIFRKQIMPGVVKEIKVLNPQIRYKVRNKGADGGFDDERCLIPLDYTIAREVNILKRQALYKRSLHFVFLSRTVVKEKWYSTGVFKAIMIAVVVVVTIYTGPIGAMMGTMVAGGTITTALVLSLAQAILTNILIGMAIQVGFNLLVEVVGAEFGFYLAVAAALAGGAMAYQAGGMAASPTALNLLKASTGLTKAVGSELENMYDDFMDDVEAFELLKEAKTEELEAAKSLLDGTIDIDPYVFIGEQPLTVWGEPPEAYFNRTVHSGNIGIQSINIVQNFVDISLRLPSTQETIGDTSYV